MTQYEKIIRLMIRRYGVQEWFYPYDFMQNGLGELFVGYEASARLSELRRDYSFLFGEKKEGKYTVTCFNFDKCEKLSDRLPLELCTAITQELSKVGLLKTTKF